MDREKLKGYIALKVAKEKAPSLVQSYALLALTPFTGGSRKLYNQQFWQIGPAMTVAAILLSGFTGVNLVYSIAIQLLIIADMLQIKKWHTERVDQIVDGYMEHEAYLNDFGKGSMYKDYDFKDIEVDPFAYLTKRENLSLNSDNKDIETANIYYTKYRMFAAHKFYLKEKTAIIQLILFIFSMLMLVVTISSGFSVISTLVYSNFSMGNQVIQLNEVMPELTTLVGSLVVMSVSLLILVIWWLKDLCQLENKVRLHNIKLTEDAQEMELK